MEADDSLLRAWQHGDRHAGNELFHRHFESVRRFFVNKVGRTYLDDVVQRTFLGCLEGRERFAGRSSFRGYLFGVAHNILREHYRAHARDLRRDPFEESVEAMSVGLVTALAKKREERLLLEGLRHIPLESQMILELYFWERFSGSQLGELLGVPENTARSRVRRAKELLVRALTQIAESRELLRSTTTDLDAWAASLRAQLETAPEAAEGN